MKKILLAAALTALTTTAFAADLKPYIEGSVGYKNFDDVDIKTSGSKVKVDSDINYGIELGLRDVLPGVRLGLSNEYIQVDTQTGTNPKSKSSVNTYQINAYYDFNISSAFTPYIGVGLGGYKSNTYGSNEFAASVKAGVNYNINNNVYAGLKAAYNFYDEAKSTSGLTSFDSFNTYSVNAVLGYKF